MNLLSAAELLADAEPTTDPIKGKIGTLGVRPEHLLLNTSEEAIRIGDARVIRIEDLGHEAHLHLSTKKGSTLTVRAGGELRHQIAPGAIVSLSVRPDMLHAFDPSTGERLS